MAAVRRTCDRTPCADLERRPYCTGVMTSRWDHLAGPGLAFLTERARLEKLTSYTALTRTTGQPGFDFDQPQAIYSPGSTAKTAKPAAPGGHTPH